MLTISDLLFLTALTVWVTGIIGMGSTGTYYDEASKVSFAISVPLAWLAVAGVIIYKVWANWPPAWG